MTVTERAIQTLQRLPPAEADELALRLLKEVTAKERERKAA